MIAFLSGTGDEIGFCGSDAGLFQENTLDFNLAVSIHISVKYLNEKSIYPQNDLLLNQTILYTTTVPASGMRAPRGTQAVAKGYAKKMRIEKRKNCKEREKKRYKDK